MIGRSIFYFRSVATDGRRWRAGSSFGSSWTMPPIWAMSCLNCTDNNAKDVKTANTSMPCGTLKRSSRLVFGYAKNLSSKINVFQMIFLISLNDFDNGKIMQMISSRCLSHMPTSSLLRLCFILDSCPASRFRA